MRWTAATLCSLVGIHAAAAQPAAAPPEPGAAATPEPAAAAPADPAPGAVDPRSDAGWQLYHGAFDALARGESARARELVRELVRDHPDHPATRIVRGTQLAGAPSVAGAPRDRPLAGGPERGPAGAGVREAPSRGARAELAAFQTLHGITIGVELCILLECESGEAGVGLAFAGGAGATLLALNAVGDLTSGQRALLNSGTAWGLVNASLIAAISEPDDVKTVAGLLLAGQGAGLAAGAAMFKAHPTAGQVALANSGGQWAGVLTGLTIAATAEDPDGNKTALAVLAAVDAGIIAGAYLASRRPNVSRAQTLVIDAGGIVGAVGGGSLGVVISGDFDDRLTPGLAAAGALVGLGAAAYFTRDWGDSTSSGSLRTYIAPPERGRGAVAGVGFVW